MKLELVSAARVGVLLAGIVAATASQAVPIISNLPGNDATSTFMNAPLGGSNGGGVHDSKAAGFTMPAGPAYNLDFVTVRINYFTTASVPMVQLYGNVSGNPSGLLHTLVAPPVAVGMSNVVFTPSSTVQLNASTTYWIVVWNNASVANSFQWMASSPSQAPTGLATNAGYRFSNGPPPPTGVSGTANSYSVNATVVPEPATFVVVCAGLLAVFRRKR